MSSYISKASCDSAMNIRKSSQKNNYIVVNNHVREVSNEASETRVKYETPVKCEATVKYETDRPIKTEIEESTNDENEVSSSTDSESARRLYEKDLEELTQFYFKCKAILKKMEKKYGDVLPLGKDKKIKSEDKKPFVYLSECGCTFKRKIVYDDDGGQVLRDVVEDHHICPKKKPYINPRRHHDTPQTVPQGIVKVENENMLPNDLEELIKMSKDPNLGRLIQQQVTQKIKEIRNDQNNLLRFEKPGLIKELKTNPDGIIDFNGANLSALPGYPTVKME